jgi:hypothetical protein
MDFSSTRLERAIDDLDESRLPRTILAEKGVNLSRLDPQRHLIIGFEIAEIFVDADGFQEIEAVGCRLLD